MFIRKKLQKRRSPFETKMYAVKQVLELNRSKGVVAEVIGFSVSAVIIWGKTFEQHGEASLQSKKLHLLPDDRNELELLRSIEKKYYPQQEEMGF